jgi:hypothetical protein
MDESSNRERAEEAFREWQDGTGHITASQTISMLLASLWGFLIRVENCPREPQGASPSLARQPPPRATATSPAIPTAYRTRTASESTPTRKIRRRGLKIKPHT